MTLTAESASTGPVLKPHRRILELDGLRALAAINLMLFHLTHVYAVKFGYTSPLGWEWPFGKYGVEMFFILSGFVNSMSLMRRGKPVDFVAARLIRIIPIFLLVIVANLWITRQMPLVNNPYTSGPMYAGQFFANMTLMPRVLGFECVDPVMWTLQVEMMFYITLVVLFQIGALRRYFIGWGTLATLSLIACPILDTLATTHADESWYAFANAIRLVMLLDFVPLFAIGFLIYMIKTKTGHVWQNLLGIVFAAFVFHAIDHGEHNPVVTVMIVSLVTLCAYGKLPLLRFRPLIYVSTISYALYLCHNNLGCVIIYRLNQSGIASNLCFAIGILFSVAMAIIVTHRIEQPLTQMLRSTWSRWRIRSAESTGLAPVES
ncbi:acyltransferase family protein [Novipirellula artificiosorum]|uniref:Acyltransferase family protein n=1 Tax=Novipirellula artificiosorum TaxID=2528016 RepID=A0A5C6DGG8_9BACT|nr:acyltransferase [Novipirellula artificiosorum]TWU35074.1 Acyltransferase family protein [Novipirellula artificiosorum]